MGFFSGLFPPAFSPLVVIDKWRTETGKSEKDRERSRTRARARERERGGKRVKRTYERAGGEREQRELQFHRIPEDEGAAGLEAFHGKPNIRGMLRRCRPEFPA